MSASSSSAGRIVGLGPASQGLARPVSLRISSTLAMLECVAYVSATDILTTAVISGSSKMA